MRQRNNQPEQAVKRATRQEDNERAVRGEATQQPAGTMRQQEGSTVRGQLEDKRVAQQEDEGGGTRGNATTSLCKTMKEWWSERMTRGRYDKRAERQEGMQQPAGEMKQKKGGAVRGRQEDKRLARREATQQPACTRQ
jgi:hypothetical protein